MDTRQKIFEAALEAFAEKGYKHTTVRDICGRADVNVAAINYHFSGKAGLYVKVFEYLFSREAQSTGGIYRDTTDPAEAEKLLIEWIKITTHVKFDTRFRTLKRRIMLREMFEPSEQFDVLMDKYISKDAGVMRGWLRVCRPELSEPDFSLVFFSMLAKCFFYFEHDKFIDGLMGQRFVEANADRIAEQIISETLPHHH